MAVYTPSATTSVNQTQATTVQRTVDRGQVNSSINQSSTGPSTSSLNQTQTNPVQPGKLNITSGSTQPARPAQPFNSPHAPAKPSVVNFTPRPVGSTPSTASALGQSQSSATGQQTPNRTLGSQLSSSNPTSMTRPSLPVGRPSLASQLQARANQPGRKPDPPADKP